MNIWNQRAFDVLIKNKGLIKGGPQGIQTIWKDKNDYSSKPNRDNVIMIPWYLCNQWTYVNLQGNINKDDDFNLLKLHNLPQGYKAIFDASSIEESSQKLLEIIDKVDWESVHLLWHSFGWVIGVFAEVLAEEKRIKSKIGKIVTLSSPLGWSEAISKLPINKLYKSLQDMNPGSVVIKAIKEEWRVGHRFVTPQDEIFPMEEMDFHRWEQHKLNHWHFDYAHWKKHIIRATAEEIQTVLLAV